MSDICRHDNPLSEHCWECDADSTKAAVKAERDRVLAVFENAPHRSIADDGTEIIEWIAPDFRVGISLEAPRADSWFCCVDGGKRMSGGDIKGDDE